MIRTLVIAEDKSLIQTLQKFLIRNNCLVGVSSTVDDCLRHIRFTPPEIILCDTVLSPTVPEQLLEGLTQGVLRIPVLFLVKPAELKLAVKLMLNGAFDCVSRHIQQEEILNSIQLAINCKIDQGNNIGHASLFGEDKNKSTPTGAYYFNDSEISNQLQGQIKVVAPTNYTVIIYGESGAGKEGVAREIHQASKRSNKPFIAIDCGALTKELAASELFGHEKGSFTGAIAQKKGQFENANGGTLLLDEVANLPYDIQVLLLRAIQEKKIRRVGGTSEIPIDVRIIVASNERLSSAVAQGKFRQDLYHRFNEFSIEVPPLRERKEDILFYAERFLKLSATELNRPITGFSEEVKTIFKSYPWYGNLREMRNVVSRATLLCNGLLITPDQLPIELRECCPLVEVAEEVATPPLPVPVHNPIIPVQDGAQEKPRQGTFEVLNLKRAAQEAEYELILNALRQADFKKAKTAELLGINRRTLYNKMKLIKQR